MMFVKPPDVFRVAERLLLQWRIRPDLRLLKAGPEKVLRAVRRMKSAMVSSCQRHE